MRRPIFFLWYYNEGLHQLLEICKNFLVFVFFYFSIGQLLLTLFSPWHRDVQIAGWRGFHPVKFLELLLENFFSRLIGAVVRLVVIAIGLASFVVFSSLAIAVVALWIGTPFLLLGFLALSLQGRMVGTFMAWLIAWLAITLIAYLKNIEISPVEMSVSQLVKSPIFVRICGRLGILRKNFPIEILENQQLLEDFLKTLRLSQAEYNQILLWEIERAQRKKEQAKFWTWEQLRKITPIGRQWRYGYTVHLDRYSQDLSAFDQSEYAKVELIGRSNEAEILKLILVRPDQNCALLVGNAGIGKKTLLHCLAREIRTGQAERSFRDARIVLLDLSQAISDAISRGQEVENQIRIIFLEAAFAGNVILVIEHLEHYLKGESNALHFDVSGILADFLSKPSFRLIATGATNEYHQLIEKQEQLVKYLETIEMSEPTESETMEIMLAQLEKYERKSVLVTYGGLREMVTSSSRHNWNVPLPERALDLMMDVWMFWNKKSQADFVTEKTVAEYLSLKTGVAQGEIDTSERKKLLSLESVLHRQVIGQKEAVTQVAEALRRARSGVSDQQKPVGSFLFLGPTGVGKTETAKALAKVYFGDEKHVIRLDMSEFQTPSSIDRLLGSSQLGQEGRLVSQIKDNPYSLLLLDEIEKAYPDILDIFLQILDEGFVTDAFGEKINFRNCLIIATSNAGAVLIKKMVENQAPAEEIKKAVVDWAVENNIFKVEFMNRFDGVIFFRPLNQKELLDVVWLKLRNFATRLDKEKNIQIDFEENLAEEIIKRGYDPIFGARSLNRYIEDTVENLVAKKIIAGEAQNGEKITIGL